MRGGTLVGHREGAVPITRNDTSLSAIDLEDHMGLGSGRGPRGSGATPYENVFLAIDREVTHVGDGSSALKPQAFVFLITDGMANGQSYDNGFDGSKPKPLDRTSWNPPKDRGITIPVLSIPAVPLAKPHDTNVGDENERVDSLIPSVPQSLQTCASTGSCKTARSATKIRDASNSMFDQATRQARLGSSFRM